MREILFMAKRIDDGEWVEGFLFSTNEHTYIAYPNQFDDDLFLSPKEIFIEVDPETVCQYTGLTDRNGRKIFEGDILSFSAYGENYKGDVRVIKGNFTIWCGKCAPFLDDALEKHSAIVIRNIFDNHELIGE